MNTNTLTGYAKQIADLLKVEADTAEAVFNEMCASGFDFSESTQRQFTREAKIALQVVCALA